MNTLYCLMAFAAAFIGAMGFGGGAVLIVFLTVFAGEKQLKAQGINLLFFIPVALMTTVFNAIKKRIDYTLVFPLCIGGTLGAAAGFFIANIIGGKAVAKIFGASVLMLGVKEVFSGIKTMLARKRER